ncbi:MAG: c-type cytochrome domain-containing protein [Myxococcota bacterium]
MSMRGASLFRVVAVGFALLLLGVGCGEDVSPRPSGEIPFEPNRPDLGERQTAPRYTGTNTIVLEAQEAFPTGLEMHRKVVARTCTPFDGVCHNSKEYPDLRTPAALLATVDAPCNVQPQEASAVFDRCEPIGDRFKFAEGAFRELEIAYVELIQGEEGETNEDGLEPGLHIHLREAVPLDREEMWGDGQFVRAFINTEGLVQDHIFFTFSTRWMLKDGGRRLVGEVRDYQREQVKELLSVGVRQGDLNRNGVFGGGPEAVKLIMPGDPDSSYLVARLRGQMNGESIPGSLMPLANQPLSIAEMLALFCFIEGLAGVDNLDAYIASDIDYAGCSYSADPEGLNLLGEGITWSGRISRILTANCGSCHRGEDADAGLNLTDGDVYTRLLTADSQQRPDMKLLVPGEPENSYLWLKLIDDETIVGEPMPININGNNQLSEAQLADFNTWLVNGATNE